MDYWYRSQTGQEVHKHLLTSHPHSFRWLWGTQPGGHYSLPTCFGAKSHRETGKIRWFRRWQLWLRVYVSSAILPSLLGLLPFFTLAVFPTFLFCLCNHTSLIMWLKKHYLALVLARVTNVPSLAGSVLVLALWVPHLEKLLRLRQSRTAGQPRGTVSEPPSWIWASSTHVFTDDSTICEWFSGKFSLCLNL